MTYKLQFDESQLKIISVMVDGEHVFRIECTKGRGAGSHWIIYIGDNYSFPWYERWQLEGVIKEVYNSIDHVKKAKISLFDKIFEVKE